MLLLEPDRTPYDLQWRMFGIPVRVHPMFWLVTALMGQNALEDGIGYLLLWIACVFVSILIHEMGHVVMGTLLGSPGGHIVLYSFGGLAIGSSDLPYRWQRIAVSLAGPLAGFLFIGLVILGFFLFAPQRIILLEQSPYLLIRYRESLMIQIALFDLVFINIMWGLLNLLPIWPLDGGRISRELFEGFIPRNGVRYSLIISLVLAGLFAVNSLVGHLSKKPLIPFLFSGGLFAAILFGLLAVGSYLELQKQRREPRWREGLDPWERDPDSRRAPWERDADWWKRG